MTPQILRALYEKQQKARRKSIPSPRASKADSITGPRRYL